MTCHDSRLKFSSQKVVLLTLCTLSSETSLALAIFVMQKKSRRPRDKILDVIKSSKSN